MWRGSGVAAQRRFATICSRLPGFGPSRESQVVTVDRVDDDLRADDVRSSVGESV